VRAALLVLAGCGRVGFGNHAPDGSDAATPTFSSVVAYARQSCAAASGRLYCWGDNPNGELGDGSMNDRASPHAVLLPSGRLDAFAEGHRHGCAIVDGTVRCWGFPGGPTPLPITLPVPATAIGCGHDFSCAIADQVYCWGIDDVGQLGDNNTTTSQAPVVVQGLPGPATALSVGDDHACVQVASGDAYCWGHNDNGTLGTGNATLPFAKTAQLVIGGHHLLPLIAGWSACGTDGQRVLCWGRNTEGELGTATPAETATPQVVPQLDETRVLAHGGGPLGSFDASCAISEDGVRCWGDGANGRLGNGQTGNTTTPIDGPQLPSRVDQIAIGYDHACALVKTGDIWCWGRGDNGELGDGRQMSSLEPVQVLAPVD